MQELQEVKIENNTELGAVVSSRTVAEELGKRHDNVMKGLEAMISETSNVSSLIIPSSYKVEGQKRSYKEYLLTKDGFTLYMFNIQGHNDFKMSYINRFNEMEREIEQRALVSDSYTITDPVERAKRWIEEQQERKQLEYENEELKPKASYYDLVLQSKSLLSVTAIAKDYGMSAKKFNHILHKMGIQYKQSNTWHLYAKYQDKGYTYSSTYIVSKDSAKVTTKWTQKGRLFLYNKLKGCGTYPVIELEQQA